MKIKGRYKIFGIVVVLLVLNIVIYLFDIKEQFTPQQKYELAQVSKDIVHKIDEPIIITFYKSDNLFPLEEHFANEIEDILTAYREESNNFIIEYVNPNESLEVELDATNSGVQSMELRGENNTLRRIFLGMTIQISKRSEVLPVLSPIMSVEYLISSSLRKLTEETSRKIAYTQGNGEPPLVGISGVIKRLNPNYDVVPVVLENIDISLYESIVIVGPSATFSDKALQKLDDFLQQGKNIFIALDRVEYDSDDDEGFKIDTGLERWLVRKGLIVHSDFIIDNSCGDVRIEGLSTPISFPYFPQIVNYAVHTTTAGISALVLRYASSIERVESATGIYTPIAKTSDVSGKKSLPLRIDFKHEWKRSDYLFPNLTVAAVLEDTFGGEESKKAKIMLISDADIALGTSELQMYDNQLFVANCIDWLSDRMGLVELKQKQGIGTADESKLKVSTLARYFNLFFPLVVLGILSGYIFFYKKYQRRKVLEKTRF